MLSNVQKKSVGQRIQISRHKQIVIAAIAVSAMLLYAVPAQQFVSATLIVIPIPDEEIEQEPEFGDRDLAQRLVDDTRQRIDQDARQNQEQEQEQEIEQELEQTNEADIDQSEENNQANVIETGDNTATTTQIGDNDATGNALASEAEGGSGESSSSSSGGSVSGDAEASSSIEQDVDNTATTTQDSSADDNVLVNENEFGDDIAVVDQDNEADQDAVNVGIQEQEQDLTQDAVNVDVNRQVAEQVQTATTIGTLTPTPTPPPPEEQGFFCIVGIINPSLCFSSLAECERALPIVSTELLECEEVETLPADSRLCRFVGDQVQC